MTNNNDQPERKAFKDWFDQSAAKMLGAQVRAAHKPFDQAAFVRRATRNLNQLELNARVQQFSDALRATLPGSVPASLEVLTQSLPPLLPDTEAVTDGWLQWPIGQFIADHGLDHIDESFAAMIELTKRFSSEFAVRPFVEKYPKDSLARLLALTSDPNAHVRRWCSEGTRPRLPWGRKLRGLVAEPTSIWPILEALKDDDELYVRRSVANNINDIAKDHPEQVVKRCRAWSKTESKNRDWLIKHGLRSLIKAGDPGALDIMGYRPPRQLRVKLSIAPKRISVGEVVEVTAELTSTSGRAQDLLVDYLVHYVRKGDKTGCKVFKWTTLNLPARGSKTVTKRHPMKVTTIRALYPGRHKVEVQVNGVVCAEVEFALA